MEMQAKEIVKQMTLNEKASLCSGQDFWNLKSVERLGLPSIMVTDGPHGLRKQTGKSDHLGINNSIPATCFPTASATACSFDVELIYEMGKALGEECRKEEVAVILGPGVNAKRSPLCGRNFEYFSEDPYLSGKIAAAWIRGVQSMGVGTSLKHFAANNQEKRRMVINDIIDERAFREIYLKSFEIAVKEAKPWTVMCAYNQLDGVYCSENSKILNDILRDEWGFEGLVVTDWGAVNDRVRGLISGLDLEMPGSSGENDALIVQAVKKGKLSEEVLDTSAMRIISMILKFMEANKQKITVNMEEHHRLAEKVASESAVLLKNEDNILPGNVKQKIAVIGTMAKYPRYQGTGSSKISPYHLDSAYDFIVQKAGNVSYADGYSLNHDNVDASLIEEAVSAAKEKDVVYLFIGLPDSYESEGFDRKKVSLPESHTQLFERIYQINQNIVVILQGGSPMELPWADKAKAILLCYLGGSAGGSACADILFGEVNPSGKLAETFPMYLADNPSCRYFPGNTLTVEYRESIYVGYRYYDTAGKDVRFPFGYGLSYTSFSYSDISLDRKCMGDNEILTVTCRISNTGERKGKEIVQLYVSHKNPTIFKAVKELKAFQKIELQPGETKEISFTLEKEAFTYYNVNIRDWDVESGEYEILIGASSRQIYLKDTVIINSLSPTEVPDYHKKAPTYYNLPKDEFIIPDSEFTELYGKELPAPELLSPKPFHGNTTIGEIRVTSFGRFIYNLLQKQGRKTAGDDPFMQNMVIEMLNDIPLRSLVMLSGGLFNQKRVDALIELLNGKILKGIKKLFT